MILSTLKYYIRNTYALGTLLILISTSAYNSNLLLPEKEVTLPGMEQANLVKENYFKLISEAKIPHTLFTIDINSGEFHKLHQENAWLNNLQFSPKETNLLRFAHEGPWHLVDRIRIKDVKTGESRLMHKSSVYMEFACQEFFSRNGEQVIFRSDLNRVTKLYTIHPENASLKRIFLFN